MRRKAVAVDVDDVDVAGTQRDALLEQIAHRARSARTASRSRISASLTSRGAMPGLARLFGEERFDLRIGDRLAALADGLVVLEEAGHRLLPEPLQLDQALEHVGAAERLRRRATLLDVPAPTSSPERSLIANGPIGKPNAFITRVDARRSDAFFGQRDRFAQRSRRSCGCR